MRVEKVCSVAGEERPLPLVRQGRMGPALALPLSQRLRKNPLSGSPATPPPNPLPEAGRGSRSQRSLLLLPLPASGRGLGGGVAGSPRGVFSQPLSLTSALFEGKRLPKERAKMVLVEFCNRQAGLGCGKRPAEQGSVRRKVGAAPQSNRCQEWDRRCCPLGGLLRRDGTRAEAIPVFLLQP